MTPLKFTFAFPFAILMGALLCASIGDIIGIAGVVVVGLFLTVAIFDL